ncbi:hypothetical protein NDU88_001381 [Pleurodeles waltl]|uniref:Uncharacterized protein n=1 Tax=Pleurodeles waltl TaxID=8319 RepID=A0AAV7UA61_PLEWA|nr:hypothetical protein NDU88_001381 [Pleurodeles waltl]
MSAARFAVRCELSAPALTGEARAGFSRPREEERPLLSLLLVPRRWRSKKEPGGGCDRRPHAQERELKTAQGRQTGDKRAPPPSDRPAP